MPCEGSKRRSVLDITLTEVMHQAGCTTIAELRERYNPSNGAATPCLSGAEILRIARGLTLRDCDVVGLSGVTAPRTPRVKQQMTTSQEEQEAIESVSSIVAKKTPVARKRKREADTEDDASATARPMRARLDPRPASPPPPAAVAAIDLLAMSASQSLMHLSLGSIALEPTGTSSAAPNASPPQSKHLSRDAAPPATPAAPPSSGLTNTSLGMSLGSMGFFNLLAGGGASLGTIGSTSLGTIGAVSLGTIGGALGPMNTSQSLTLPAHCLSTTAMRDCADCGSRNICWPSGKGSAVDGANLF